MEPEPLRVAGAAVEDVLTLTVARALGPSALSTSSGAY